MTALETGARPAALGWIVFAVALLIGGVRYCVPDLRVQAYILAVLAFGAAVLYDLFPPSVPIGAAVIAGLYLLQWITSGAGLSGREQHTPVVLSLLGTALSSMLLYGRVSGGLLTVAWGFQGLLLLGSGFWTHQRILRLQGLVLLLACILKVFLYDLRNLETMYRILSFIALGVIMLSVSWIYTRFREHIKRYL